MIREYPVPEGGVKLNNGETVTDGVYFAAFDCALGHCKRGLFRTREEAQEHEAWMRRNPKRTRRIAGPSLREWLARGRYE